MKAEGSNIEVSLQNFVIDKIVSPILALFIQMILKG
jgi:hypothetical protein